MTCQSTLLLALDAAGNGIIDPAALVDSASDPCTDDADLVLSVDGGGAVACVDIGDLAATLRVADESGNEATCPTTVTVVDTTAPAPTCGPISVTLDAITGGTTLSDVSQVSVTDACDPSPTIVLSPATLDCDAFDTNTYTAEVSDAAGNTASCSGTLVVVDNTAPMISCPADFTSAQAATSGVVSVGPATATDNTCDPAALTFTNDLDGGGAIAEGVFVDGDYAVVFTVSDAGGNVASCTTMLTYRAALTLPPVINTPDTGDVFGFSPIFVSFTLPEAAAAGTVILSFRPATDDAAFNAANTGSMVLDSPDFESEGNHFLEIETLSLASSDGVASLNPGSVLALTPGLLYDLVLTYADTDGNPPAIALESDLFFDGLAPVLTITSSNTNPTPLPIDLVFSFSEPVLGFNFNDVQVCGGVCVCVCVCGCVCACVDVCGCVCVCVCGCVFLDVFRVFLVCFFFFFFFFFL